MGVKIIINIYQYFGHRYKKMRHILFLTFLTCAASAFAQNGYIKIEKDSILVGFLRYYISYMDGQQLIEYWRTKTDKEPIKISKRDIIEYAIKKDTFIVLHQYSPFENSDLYFELADAKKKISGKINLYWVPNNDPNRVNVSTVTGGGLIPGIIDAAIDKKSDHYDMLYMLENRKTGGIRPIPKNKERLEESLTNFFPQEIIQEYRNKKGTINYQNLPGLVKYYNATN